MAWRRVLKKPYEPLMLWLNFKLLLAINLLLSFIAICIWANEYDMVCISKYSRFGEITDAVKRVCREYPYTFTDTKQEERHYVVYYKWFPHIMLILTAFSIIPIKTRNELFRKDLRQYLRLFTKPTMDGHFMVGENYVFNFFYTSDVYKGVIMCHIVCLLVHAVSFFFLELSLQGRFLGMVLLNYPFERWVEHFNDYLSVTFPPFVECEINPQMKLWNVRSEQFGCELSFMPMVMHICIFLWLFFVLLFVGTFVSLLYYLLLPTCTDMKKQLLPSCDYNKGNKAFLLKKLSMNDLLLLSYIDEYCISDVRIKILDTSIAFVEKYRKFY